MLQYLHLQNLADSFSKATLEQLRLRTLAQGPCSGNLVGSRTWTIP